jgi:hypothetical protein
LCIIIDDEKWLMAERKEKKRKVEERKEDSFKADVDQFRVQ